MLDALNHSNDALPSPYQVTLIGLYFCRMARAIVGASPGFPVDLVGVGELHAAFLMKAAGADVGGAPWQEIRLRPVFFGPCTLGRTLIE